MNGAKTIETTNPGATTPTRANETHNENETRNAEMINAEINNGMTEETEKLFVELVADAWNWAGMPLWDGNVAGSKERRGNLTNLKRMGLVKTEKRDGLTWVIFTAEADKLAVAMGYDMPTDACE